MGGSAPGQNGMRSDTSNMSSPGIAPPMSSPGTPGIAPPASTGIGSPAVAPPQLSSGYSQGSMQSSLGNMLSSPPPTLAGTTAPPGVMPQPGQSLPMLPGQPRSEVFGSNSMFGGNQLQDVILQLMQGR